MTSTRDNKLSGKFSDDRLPNQPTEPPGNQQMDMGCHREVRYTSYNKRGSVTMADIMAYRGSVRSESVF